MAVPGRVPGPARVPEPPEPRWFSWQPLAVVLFLVCMVLIGWFWLADPFRWRFGSGLLVVPLLTLFTVPLFRRAARSGAAFDLAGLMAVGMLLRFISSLYRYDYRSDGGVYHQIGSVLAESFRNLQFDVDTERPIPGTGGMRYLTGLVEVFTNSNEFATFLVFTWLGFLGCYCFYQAFVTALPDGDHRRYALLIYLWPTLVFWPSSIGKDCWMLFTIGIASLGAARVLVRRPGGYSLLVVGLLLCSVVRPHVAAVSLIALAVALLIGRRGASPSGGVTPASVAKVAGLVLLLALGAVLANRLGDFLNATDVGGFDNALSENIARTTEGSSAFTPANPQNPFGYVQAGVTILVRPFVFEAAGLDQVLTGFEGMFLVVLAAASWRRLASVPFRLRREPYVAYALSTVLMMIFVLGTIANFGILSRQRTQVIPFVFVLLCVNVVRRDAEVRRSPPPRVVR